MRIYIAVPLIISSILLSSERAVGQKEAFSGSSFSSAIGLAPRYEDITMRRNHPPSPHKRPPKGVFGGVTLTGNFYFVNATLDYQFLGQTYRDDWDVENDTRLRSDVSEHYLTLKEGLQILPSNWAVQLIPEVGYSFLKEKITVDSLAWNPHAGVFVTREKKICCLYEKKYRDRGIFFGISSEWKLLSSHSIVLSYSHNNLEHIKIDGYLLQWRYYLSDIEILDFLSKDDTDREYYQSQINQDNSLMFYALEVGVSTKTDGRKSYYFGLQWGGEYWP